MLRLILGVVLGLIVSLVMISVVEGVGHTIFPPPPGVNLTDPAQLASAMSKIPFQAKVGVVLAWLLGALAGAATANVVAGRRAWAGRIVGLIVLALAIFNMSTIVHPAWMAIGVVVAILVGAALAELGFGKPRAR